MKRSQYHNIVLKLSVILLLLLFSFLTVLRAQTADSTKGMIQNANLGRGINLGNALEAPDIGEWGVVLQEEYFRLIAEQGFHSVRVPIRWNAHASHQPPYGIEGSFFQTVDWVIENSLKNGLYVVINFHHYEALYSDPDAEKGRFLKLWEHVCNRYADYSDSLIFEILNEPHGNLIPSKWNSLLVETYDLIRELNPERTIVIGTAEYGGIGGLSKLELPMQDDNIIVTVHYYEPFRFTHQGAGWVSGSDPWLGTGWDNSIAARQNIINDFQQVVDFSEKHNVPVYVGEFGAYSKAGYQSRVRWTNFIPRHLEELGFSWAYWEFCSGFGIYNSTGKFWSEGLVYALQHMPMSNPSDGELPQEAKNLVTNPDFSDSTNFWYLYTDENSDASATFAVQNGEAEISQSSEPGAVSSVALINSGLQLENKKAYRVSFNAYAKSNQPIEVSVMQGTDPWIWDAYTEIQRFDITSETSSYSFYFTMDKPTDHNARLRFNLGTITDTVFFGNVAVEDLSIVQDTSKNILRIEAKDLETKENLNDFQVTVSNQMKSSNDDFFTEFTELPVGYHKIDVSKKHYLQDDSTQLPLYKDTTATIFLSKKVYRDTVVVIDSASNNPVSGVVVQLADQQKKTDLSGEVVFDVTFGTYPLTIEKEGYRNILSMEQTVLSDTSKIVKLVKTHAGVKFKFVNDGQPVKDVLISIDDQTANSNSLGIAEFKLLPLQETIEFSAEKTGYDNETGSFTLLNDTTLQIELTKNLVDIRFNISSDDEALQDATIILDNDTTKTNNSGFAGFYDKPINNTYTYRILHKGFALAEGEVIAMKDTTLQVQMIASGIVNTADQFIRVYPNPASEKIHISANGNLIKKVTLYSLSGAVVDEKKGDENQVSIDVSNLNAGEYISVIILEDGASYTTRFVVEN